MSVRTHEGRERLPDRRRTLIVAAAWIDPHGMPHTLEVSPGFYPDGRIGEVFARTAKPNSTLDTMLDEGCQLVSRLLQRGCALSEIANGMAGDDRGRAETPLGVVVTTLIDLEGGG